MIKEKTSIGPKAFVGLFWLLLFEAIAFIALGILWTLIKHWLK